MHLDHLGICAGMNFDATSNLYARKMIIQIRVSSDTCKKYFKVYMYILVLKYDFIVCVCIHIYIYSSKLIFYVYYTYVSTYVYIFVFK